MNKKEKTTVSKFIALILRHHPEEIGITLDDHGWADVSQLIEGIRKRYPLDREILQEIVDEDEKQRYAFNADKTKIRANQGHSVPVDADLAEAEPPAVLYHGTADRFTASIEKQGLLPQSRLYVHLSADEETAKKTGRRHGRPALYLIDCASMRDDGHVFFRSANGVWLVRHVPPRYLHRIL
ncbi:MAG: RNA 2'-phosphotransferase [Solobacterium sp.]|nr:RNA 2'-phosphotransferase [Solobacterium sp.]